MSSGRESRWEHHRRSSSLTDSILENECEECVSSPTAWIFDIAAAASRGCSGFERQHRGEDAISGGRESSSRMPSGGAEWRRRAAKTVLSGSDEECDDDERDNINASRRNNNSRNFNASSKAQSTNLGSKHSQQNTSSSQRETVPETSASTASVSSSGGKSSSNPEMVPGEPRIVAPNVGKLSPQSVVEVRLQSVGEVVAVLCAVDVLKMRSGFFHQVLAEQEKNRSCNTPLSISSSASSVGIWREPVTIPEVSPFEAAAFLESLHEGRSLFKGEWNACWARLSVTWLVDELAAEYAHQIENHLNKLLTTIQDTHWRTNPNAFLNYRIAVFRKGISPLPTVILGTVVESVPTTGYSKLRVAFDNDIRVGTAFTPGIASTSSPFRDPMLSHSITPSNYGREQPMIGDVSEPFWVQKAVEGSVWCEPDELFMNESKRLISVTDKRVFWEMARAIIELPELANRCSNGIRNTRDLTNILKRPENKVLWTPDAPDILPKEVSSELVSVAYVCQA